MKRLFPLISAAVLFLIPTAGTYAKAGDNCVNAPGGGQVIGRCSTAETCATFYESSPDCSGDAPVCCSSFSSPNPTCLDMIEEKFGASTVDTHAGCYDSGDHGKSYADCIGKGGQVLPQNGSDCSVDTGVCCALEKGAKSTCAAVANVKFPGAVKSATCAATCAPPSVDAGVASECPPTQKCCAVTAAGSSTKLTNPLGEGTTFFDVIQRLIRTFLGFVGALALLVFIYAGVTWMTAGSSDRIQKAKDSMKYAVIGLALIVFAYAITTFFLKTLAGG